MSLSYLDCLRIFPDYWTVVQPIPSVLYLPETDEIVLRQLMKDSSGEYGWLVESADRKWIVETEDLSDEKKIFLGNL